MRKSWSKEEELYMERRYIRQPVERTAKFLNRTIPSVKRKAAKMQLNHYTDYFGAKTIANCFDCDVSVVIRWIQKLHLPCKIVSCSTQTRYLIDPEEFWIWAEKNRNKINWSKYKKMSICPEPKWLNEEIEKYSVGNHRRKYTSEDIIRVKNMLHKGMTYSEIASQMGRTYYGISHLCREIYQN